MASLQALLRVVLPLRGAAPAPIGTDTPPSLLIGQIVRMAMFEHRAIGWGAATLHGPLMRSRGVKGTTAGALRAFHLR